MAVNLKDVKLENGSTYAKALATYPQWIDNGMISGLFPAYTVQSGDRFRAYLGFRADCGIGKVKYQLKYREGATDTLLGELIKSCDGAVLAIEKDLSSLAGKSIQLILIVSAEGTYKEDRAVWANPRIER